MLVALFVAVGVLFALGLYTLRSRCRLVYGLIEIASGVVIMLGAINSYSAALGREYVPIVGGGIFHRPPEGWLHWSAPTVALFGVAAAIYILVRGLDNIGEGLSETNRRCTQDGNVAFVVSRKCVPPNRIRHAEQKSQRRRTETRQRTADGNTQTAH